MQPHSNVMRLFTSTHALFQFCSRDVWVLYHAYVFDFSVWEMWGALTYGGKLLIPSYHDILDMQHFYQLCLKQHVTVLTQTPSAFQVFSEQVFVNTEQALELRYVIFGGEALHASQLTRWWDVIGEKSPALINM